MRHTLSADSKKKISTAIYYSISDTYKNFCGIYGDMKPGDSKLRLDTIIDDIKENFYILQGDERKESIDIFFEYQLWELELGVLYCLEDARVKKSLLEKFAYNDKLIFRLQNAKGFAIEYMKIYIRYLILCINTHGEDAMISSKNLLECRSLIHYCVIKLQTTNSIAYQILLCKLYEKYKEPVEVEQHYNHLFGVLQTNPNYNRLLSMSYYDFSRYLENLSAIDKMKLGANIKIECYYEKALLIDPDNYKAQYKLIFYRTKEKDKIYSKIKMLQEFVATLMKFEDENQGCLRNTLYQYKGYYSLGLLYKQIGEKSKALEAFSKAQEIYREMIKPIWEYMGMNKDYIHSEEALKNYLNIMLLYHHRAIARFETETENKS